MLLALNFTACTEWGEADPEAGNQTYADRTVVSTFSFEYGEDETTLGDITDKTDVCEVVEDETLASNVLHLDANGCAKMANPFNGVKLQDGAAITFWLKTAGVTTESAEGEEATVEDDLTGAIFAFGSEAAGTERFYFTANGQLSYTKPGNLESQNLDENNPSSVTTGILPAGDWHFVALQISDDGYQLYIDGNKSLSGFEPQGNANTTFSYKTLVEFINTAPYLYIGKGAGDDDVNMSEMWIEDVKLVRNHMIASDYTKPNKGSGGGGDEFEYVVGDPITVVGATDNSSAWWTEFSNYFRLPSETTMRLRFINHTSGEGNWNNWNLCLATDAERQGDGYAEYFVLRSDLYGWGDANYNAGNITNTGYNDWDKFRQDMEGATVDVTIQRSGAEIYVTAIATATNGTVYQENYHQTCGDGSQIVRAFFVVDGSHLQFDWDNCNIIQQLDVPTIQVGASDNSSAWWSTFSDYFTIPANKTMVINFENHTSGANNWNNWVLALTTDADRDGDGYAEYFVLRSDLYGWGDANYNAGNIAGVGYNDWAQFLQDMEGAQVEITIQRTGEEVYLTAVATSVNGTVYQETYHQSCGDGTQTVRAFLTCDSSHYIMDPDNCYLQEPLFQ